MSDEPEPVTSDVQMDLPEEGDTYHPTVNTGGRGYTPSSRRILSCYEHSGRMRVYFVSLDEVEKRHSTLLTSFRDWVRRNEAHLEKASRTTPLPVVEDLITEELDEDSAVDVDEIACEITEEKEEPPREPVQEKPTTPVSQQEQEPVDDFTQVAAAMRAALEKKKAVKQENVVKQEMSQKLTPLGVGPQPTIPVEVTPSEPVIQQTESHDDSVERRDLSSSIRANLDKLQKSSIPELDSLFQPYESVVVFIDGANHDISLKRLVDNGLIYGMSAFDYKKLRLLFQRQCRLVRVYYYIGLIVDRHEHQKERARLDWMSYNNIHVKIKQAERSVTGHIVKSNVDVELAIDMYRLVASTQQGSRPNINHIVLFSGDSDFEYPLELIKSMGVRVTVIGSLLAGTMSDKLRRSADQFVELKDLIQHMTSVTQQN